MNATDYLEKDTSYLVDPHNTIWNLIFGKIAKDEGCSTKMKERIGNQREAYESGFKIGWETGIREMERSTKFPYNMTLRDKEYRDFISLLTVFGYSLFYYSYNPTEEFLPKKTRRNYHAGLNITKNYNAIERGNTISEEVKQQVYKILKENSDPRLWTL